MFKSAFATIVVANMDRALTFYTATLGLRAGTRDDNFALVHAPGVTIGLHPKPEQAKLPQGNLSIGFEVEDIETVVRLLTARAVVFARFENDEAKFAFFADPDGAPLYLIEGKAKDHG